MTTNIITRGSCAGRNSQKKSYAAMSRPVKMEDHVYLENAVSRSEDQQKYVEAAVPVSNANHSRQVLIDELLDIFHKSIRHRPQYHKFTQALHDKYCCGTDK